jgi:hypothetical protein
MPNEAPLEIVPAPQYETITARNISSKPAEIPAIARCNDAWRRVYVTKLGKRSTKFEASQAAAEAYRQAMPPLVGHGNIRDFIGCVGNAILHHIIIEPEGTRLLYAAQVALSSVRLQPRTKEPDESKTTTPRAK